MARVLAKPWNYPPGQSDQHRLVHIIDLPQNSQWTDVSKYFKHYKIERTHFFGTQGLVQFFSSEDARKFVNEHGAYLPELRATVTLSSLPFMIGPNPSTRRTLKSRVICIQVIRLHGCLGIQDIFEECSHFGNVMKIICFEKLGKFALVQMENVEQAAMALANLSKSTRYTPTFELRVQYSRNNNIVVQFNNSKSFDFTLPGAAEQFEKIREGLTGEPPFFEPDKADDVPPNFEYFRPFQYDLAFGNSLTISGFPAERISTDFIRNVFCQYGVVFRVKVLVKAQNCTAFVQMRNSMFARLALTNLNDMCYNGSILHIEVSNHPDVHQETTNPNSVQLFKEYPEADDPDVGVYAEMWPPSKYVHVRPKRINIGDLVVPNGKYIEEMNAWMFNTIDEATDFIGTQSQVVHNKRTITLMYARPPSL